MTKAAMPASVTLSRAFGSSIQNTLLATTIERVRSQEFQRPRERHTESERR